MISSSVPTIRSQSGEHALHLAGDGGPTSRSARNPGMAGEAPEIGAVVDVEHDLAAVRLGDADRLALRGFGVGPGEMRAGDDDGAGRRDEGLVDVAPRPAPCRRSRCARRSSANAFVLDREQHERGQPLLVGGDALDRLTPSRASCSRMKRPICSSPTRVSSAERSPSRAVPIAMLAGQPPTDLAKEADVLQPRADLLAVEVDRRAADGDDVERPARVRPAVPPCLPPGLAAPSWKRERLRLRENETMNSSIIVNAEYVCS
jgi:hypothetical protein